jgi:hypothetical protein
VVQAAVTAAGIEYERDPLVTNFDSEEEEDSPEVIHFG